MASFVPLHGSWCWFKMKARARKVPGRARASDDPRASRATASGRLLRQGRAVASPERRLTRRTRAARPVAPCAVARAGARPVSLADSAAECFVTLHGVGDVLTASDLAVTQCEEVQIT